MQAFRSHRILLPLLLLTGLFSCEKAPQPDAGEAVLEVALRRSEGDKAADAVFVSVTATGNWTLSLAFEEGDGWASLSAREGTGNKSNIILDYAANATGEDRGVTICAKSGLLEASAYFVQRGRAADPQRPDAVAGWLELPGTYDDDGLSFYHHEMTLGTVKTRNYSYYWDKQALVAHWVAYPLNSWTISTGTRTNAWGTLDPKLPESQQPILYKGFSGYDRGHQLPSADRLSLAANVQTFYGTNITPQLGSLNQKIWATLEGNVRDWCRKFDTLYVVTGCCVEKSTKVAYDNAGKAVKVPTAYYKALLGYCRNGTFGITQSTGGYSAIGFYFPHEAYNGSVMDKAMTVDELEKLVQVDFFVNLPADIETIVESTRDNAWWKL
ncbi:MAG: DNA/RNA non-specific endonuclease [Bacteroidales bacterium]|nr:DNA/RNA non-specific endonuclease [Bacteroidales bacterium]